MDMYADRVCMIPRIHYSQLAYDSCNVRMRVQRGCRFQHACSADAHAHECAKPPWRDTCAMRSQCYADVVGLWSAPCRICCMLTMHAEHHADTWGYRTIARKRQAINMPSFMRIW